MMDAAFPVYEFLFQTRTRAVLLALLNFQVLPLAWHVRLSGNFCITKDTDSHSKDSPFLRVLLPLLFDSRPIPQSSSTSLVLFQPTSHTSKAPLGELD